MPYDNLCKYLSEKYPEEFATWLLGQVPAAVEVLKTELSIEPIRADFVTFLRTQERILHLEFQVEVITDPPIPLRMLDYWVRLYRRYRLPVTQVIILLKPTAVRLSEEFQLEGTQHRYQVVRLWEQDPEIFLENAALLPLAVLSRAETPRQLLSRVTEQVAKIEKPAERGEISTCTQVLAGLWFDQALIRQFFREGMMRESVIYQEILKEGLEQGLQQGLQQGLKASIMEALEIRFEAVPRDVVEQLSSLTPDQLKLLHRQALTCVDLEDFRYTLAALMS